MERSSAVIYVRALRVGDSEIGLAEIAGRPMIEYVLDSVPDDVDDIVIAVEDGAGMEVYDQVAEKYFARAERAGKIEGNVRKFVELAIRTVEGDRLVILPCNAPLITREFTTFLLECSSRFSGAFPRTPARKTLYLMASYRKKPFKEAFEAFPDEDMDGIVKRVRGTLYLASNSLRIFDERLGMFFRVSSTQDLKKAEKILKMRSRS
ncbi:MAG: NTP transferase domain-containing protein [Nitrososphaerota archaeon]|nr:NTP transferase domain-containing protein [Nitrososphaerota archaeon]